MEDADNTDGKGGENRSQLRNERKPTNRHAIATQTDSRNIAETRDDSKSTHARHTPLLLLLLTSGLVAYWYHSATPGKEMAHIMPIRKRISALVGGSLFIGGVGIEDGG